MSSSGEQQHGSPGNGSDNNNQHNENGQDANNDNNNAIAERHAQFVQALERLDLHTNDSSSSSNNNNDWSSRMASELNWTVDQVERHAYRYFTLLLSDHDEPNNSPPDTMTPASTTTTTSQNNASAFGSQEEILLMDTLLAQYRPVLGQGDGGQDESDDAWIERIAQNFPHKTVAEIQRYIRMNINHQRSSNHHHHKGRRHEC
jgi:hypothetical protein